MNVYTQRLYLLSLTKYINAHFLHHFILSLSLSCSLVALWKASCKQGSTSRSIEVWGDDKLKEALQWDGQHHSPQRKQWLRHTLTILLSVMGKLWENDARRDINKENKHGRQKYEGMTQSKESNASPVRSGRWRRRRFTVCGNEWEES